MSDFNVENIKIQGDLKLTPAVIAPGDVLAINEIGVIEFVKPGVKSDLTSPNEITKFWSGTQAQYDEIEIFSPTTIYFIED
jgi:hypothetical protein